MILGDKNGAGAAGWPKKRQWGRLERGVWVFRNCLIGRGGAKRETAGMEGAESVQGTRQQEGLRV